MRIVFMGSPECAVTVLQKLLESPAHQIVAVVTQPDKPAGRGRVETAPPVKLFALRHQLPVLQPDTLKNNPELLQRLSQLSADVFVVVAYGKILPPEILAIPRLGCINVHFSLLPKYRGAAPVQWAIINGEKITGVTIMKMNERLDEGEILASEQVEILDDDDTISLTNILSCLGGELLLRVLEQAEKTQKLLGTPQNNSQASYAPKLKKEDGLLDWSLPNEKIICRIKGLLPWPCAFTFLNGKLIKILGAEPISLETISAISQLPAENTQPGTVVALAKGRGFIVRTGDGFLLITKVQPQDKQVMSGVAFVNGGYVKAGDRFETLSTI
ncbi:MAG: methionyl-tRNA formyltransferase [Candidatus Sumerlaeia bacterium]|nr:methionyl-tRNA formyltransferase [Candidatus Sumerlaeia bacterium]